jgi:tubulin polyglutamylase TTLL6/13
MSAELSISFENEISNRENKKCINIVLPSCNQKPRKKKPKVQPTIDISETQYSIVKDVTQSLHYIPSVEKDSKNWNLKWVDTYVDTDQLTIMSPYQKINHYPGMCNITRKNLLGRNLQRLAKAFPEEYSFFPRTWLLPSEYNDLKKDMKLGKHYIVKPEASCQGKGIFIINSIEQINKDDHYVVQSYLTNPYLIDSLKFDLRIYALVYGVDPLRIFIYDQGLARFATEKYLEPNSTNFRNMYMHLTNYAINKNSSKFEFNEDSDQAYTGHKRCLEAIWKYIDGNGGDSRATKQRIADIIIKTVCTIEPILNQIYKSCQIHEYDNSCCFEVLGFDIILDSGLNPILLEVNHSPSFSTDTPFDYKVKKDLISDTFKILNMSGSDKNRFMKIQKSQTQHMLFGKSTKEMYAKRQIDLQHRVQRRINYENKHLGGYSLIYPLKQNDLYSLFIMESKKMWEAFTGVAKKEVAAITKSNSRNSIKRSTSTVKIIANAEKKKTKGAAKENEIKKACLTPLLESTDKLNITKLFAPKMNNFMGETVKQRKVIFIKQAAQPII